MLQFVSLHYSQRLMIKIMEIIYSKNVTRRQFQFTCVQAMQSISSRKTKINLKQEKKHLPRSTRRTFDQFWSDQSLFLRSYMPGMDLIMVERFLDCDEPGHTSTHIFICLDGQAFKPDNQAYLDQPSRRWEVDLQIQSRIIKPIVYNSISQIKHS